MTDSRSTELHEGSRIGETADLALSAFGLGWHYEAGLEWVRLVAAGVFDELPDLQIILGHWGEVALFYIERIGAVLDRALDLDPSLAECARRNLYVTGSGMWSESYLRRWLDIVGPERLLFSTDFPTSTDPEGSLADLPRVLNSTTRRGQAWHAVTGRG